MIIRCNNYHVFYFIIFYIAIRAWLPQQHMSVTACQQFVYLYQPLHTRRIETVILEMKGELSLKNVGRFQTNLCNKFKLMGIALS